MAQEYVLPRLDKSYDFPSDMINPAKKDKAYALQMCRATYNANFSAFNNAYGNSRRSDWINNRLWANGIPPLEKFKKKFSHLQDATGQLVSYVDLDYKMVSLIPKIRDTVVGYIEGLEYDITATAINPAANDTREAAKWRIHAKKRLSDFAKTVNQMAAAQVASEEEPKYEYDTIEELNMLFSLTFKMIEEEAIEIGNEVVLNESDWRKIKKLMLEDLFDCGACAIETLVDEATMRPKVRYVDVVNLIYPPFRGHSLDAPERIGYIETLTVGQIAAATDEFDANVLKAIATRFKNAYGNNQIAIDNNWVNTDDPYSSWLQYNVPVMTLYWETVDTYKYENYTDRNGKQQTRPVPFETPSGKRSYKDWKYAGVEKESKVTDGNYHCYYGAKWIIGTDYIYNVGKVENLARDPKNVKKTLPPIKMYRVSQESHLERMLAPAEQIYLAWIKMQNSIATAIPSGFQLDVDPLLNMVIDGRDWSIKDLVELYLQKGILLYKGSQAMDADGRPTNQRPIIEMANGLGKDFIDQTEIIEYNIKMMRDVSGINEFTDASTPSDRALKGVAEMAVKGTQNALSQLVSAITTQQEDTCIDITQKLQYVVNHGNFEGYVPSMGAELVRAAFLDKSINSYTYGIRIVAKPTAQERQTMKQAAYDALVNIADPIKGGLKYDDYTYICSLIDSGTNVKVVSMIMGHRIRKNLKEVMEMGAANSKAQTDGQIALEAAKKDAAIELEQQLSAIRTAEYQQKVKADWWLQSQIMGVKTEQNVLNQNVKAEHKANENVQKAMLEQATA